MTRERTPGATPPEGARATGESLEERIYREILHYPERIDQMESRSEESCRQIARRIAALVAAAGRHPPDER